MKMMIINNNNNNNKNNNKINGNTKRITNNKAIHE